MCPFAGWISPLRSFKSLDMGGRDERAYKEWNLSHIALYSQACQKTMFDSFSSWKSENGTLATRDI